MALKPPPPWEVLAQVGELVGGADTRDEIDRNVRSLAQSALSRLDMVSREEFDAQAALLQRMRDRVTALEDELEALTAQVDGNPLKD